MEITANGVYRAVHSLSRQKKKKTGSCRRAYGSETRDQFRTICRTISLGFWKSVVSRGRITRKRREKERGRKRERERESSLPFTLLFWSRILYPNGDLFSVIFPGVRRSQGVANGSAGVDRRRVLGVYLPLRKKVLLAFLWDE